MRYVQELHLLSLAWQLEVLCLSVRLKEFAAKYVQFTITETVFSKVCLVVGWFVQ